MVGDVLVILGKSYFTVPVTGASKSSTCMMSSWLLSKSVILNEYNAHLTGSRQEYSTSVANVRYRLS